MSKEAVLAKSDPAAAADEADRRSFLGAREAEVRRA
jgi:hypothetical protein